MSVGKRLLWRLLSCILAHGPSEIPPRSLEQIKCFGTACNMADQERLPVQARSEEISNKRLEMHLMPQCFKEHYPGTTCIINCSEISLQKPRNLNSRGESCSHYNGQNMVKFMVAIAPCGLIVFISPAYGGMSNDKFYHLWLRVPRVPPSRWWGDGWSWFYDQRCA